MTWTSINTSKKLKYTDLSVYKFYILMSDLDGIQNCRQFLILNLPVKISLCFPYSSVGCFSVLSQSVKYRLSIYRYEILFLTYAHTAVGKPLRYLGQPTLSFQCCILRTFTCLSAYPLFSVLKFAPSRLLFSLKENMKLQFC